MLGAVGWQRKVIFPLGTPASRESLSLSHKTVLLNLGPLQGLLGMPPLQVSRPGLLPDQQTTTRTQGSGSPGKGHVSLCGHRPWVWQGDTG